MAFCNDKVTFSVRKVSRNSEDCILCKGENFLSFSYRHKFNLLILLSIVSFSEFEEHKVTLKEFLVELITDYQ